MNDTSTGSVRPVALGKAAGVLWAGGVVFLGLLARWHWGEEWRDLLADVYLGYDSTNRGLVIGALWAFVDGFVAAYLLARLYNRFR